MNAKKLQAKIQKFGSTLSAMVMPNIGVFIGWGVLAALFIDTGWLPNAYWNELVSPILTYLLPVLIGYTAGANIHGRRGGVIGAFATMGAVVGSDVTMLVGGMIMGPLAAWVLKKFDKAVEGKVKPGLEMMVDNFSLGLIGVVLCMAGYAAVAPTITVIQGVIGAGVRFLMNKGVLPLVYLFVTPGQVLFLNNAINHGIMVPLALQQAAETGKSVLFLVEGLGANWVGLALAFSVFGTGNAKKSAPGAAFIMFFGGIAEVCFPYCLMMPLTIIGPMVGNAFALFVLTTFGGGTVGAVSPGSVLAMYMMTPKDSIVVNTIAYFGSVIITFIVTGFILKVFGPKENELQAAGETAGTIAAASTGTASSATAGTLSALNKVIFACDAGMGSSAMGVSILRSRLQKVGLHPAIDHVAVSAIPSDADVVVTNVSLAERAKMTTEGRIPIITLSNFMDQKEYDRIVAEIQGMLKDGAGKSKGPAPAAKKSAPAKAAQKPILPLENIVLNASFRDKRSAIEACADILIKGGYVLPSYKEDMIKRDEEDSVYLGDGVAMPHGLATSRDTIQHSGLCFVLVPGGVDFGGEKAYILIGVAGKGEEHVDILGHIGNHLSDESVIAQLRKVKNKQEVLDILELDSLKL